MAVTSSKRDRLPAGTRDQHRQARAQRKRKRCILGTSLVVLLVGGLVAVVLWALLTPKPGEYVPSQGNTHITEAEMGQFAYST